MKVQYSQKTEKKLKVLVCTESMYIQKVSAVTIPVTNKSGNLKRLKSKHFVGMQSRC